MALEQAKFAYSLATLGLSALKLAEQMGAEVEQEKLAYFQDKLKSLEILYPELADQ